MQPTTREPEAPATEQDAFESLDRTLKASGPGAALEELAKSLGERGEFRALLDALLLKARFDLGLPLVQVGLLADIPEPTRTKYEDRYVEALREVGRRVLATGDIAGAWPYFRAIGEKDAVVEAIEKYESQEGDSRLSAVIEVAFNHGVHPRKGFALILDHYGACSAITAFEQLPPDEATRIACADRLVRLLYDHLLFSLRADIERQGKPLPPEGTSISEIVADRPWLFEEEAYHIDVSHLSAVVRIAPLLTDAETIAPAVGLCDYGRNLSPRHRYEGDPPFERHYEDHALYLRGLLGQDVPEALRYFRSKLPTRDPEGDGDTIPAQVLVRLLVRLGRLEEAIDVAAEHLAGVPESMLGCSSLAQLCQMARRPDRLAKASREVGDLVGYAAGRVQE